MPHAPPSSPGLLSAAFLVILPYVVAFGVLATLACRDGWWPPTLAAVGAVATLLAVHVLHLQGIGRQ